MSCDPLELTEWMAAAGDRSAVNSANFDHCFIQDPEK